MLTSDQPCAANQADSARVENRGPCTTTIVPPSTAPPAPLALSPAPLVLSPGAPAANTAARPTAQYGSANETWTAPES